MADTLAIRNEYRARSWAMVIQECSTSGLSNREFCRQRGISEKSFYYWLRKFRSQIAEATTPQLVPLIDPQSFRRLMEGLKIEQRTAIRKGKPKDLF